MFYTIISRIPHFTNDTSKNKFLKIFIVGSVLYILIHYYLNIQVRAEILEKTKKYVYYILPVDLATTYILCKYYDKKRVVNNLCLLNYDNDKTCVMPNKEAKNESMTFVKKDANVNADAKTSSSSDKNVKKSSSDTDIPVFVKS